MELSIPPGLVYVASWLSITGGVWALFDRAETVATEQTKAAVSRWLRNLDPVGPLAHWPAVFARVFDQVFGERHLSWRCFRMSCIASVASAGVVTGIWAMLHRQEAAVFLTRDLAGNLPLALAVILLSLVINTVPDYLSLLKTRYVIHWMGQRASIVRTLGLFWLDLLLTGVLASAVILFFASRVSLTIAGIPTGLVSLDRAGKFVTERVLPLTAAEGVPVLMSLEVTFPREALDAVASRMERDLAAGPGARGPGAASRPPRPSPGSGPPAVRILGIPWGIFFYSTFFTSVWVWLYAVAGGLLRLASYLGLVLRGLRGILDIQNKPLRSIGMVSNLLITLVYMGMPFWR